MSVLIVKIYMRNLSRNAQHAEVSNVDREYFESHKINEIRFKFEGKGGEEAFTIPASYIKDHHSIVTITI